MIVTVHVWGVRAAAVPRAVLRMATGRRPLRRSPGLRFGKLVGTGSGRTFTVRDADPRHWGVVAVWDSAAAAEAFDDGPVARSWARIADERLRVRMRPLATRGSWAGNTPFTQDDATAPGAGSDGAGPDAAAPGGGMVAAITRARLRPSQAVTFWRSVPPVSADLARFAGNGGLRLAIGIGEAPIGLQGTFSLWASARALTDYAYRGAPHRAAMRRTVETGWYAEELFARFAVLDVDGTFDGRTP